MTGVDPKPVGRKGLVTKARSFSPVVFLLVELGLEYFAHETRNNVPSRTKIGAAFSFKPGTPKRMRDGELDAKRWIITEQKLWYSLRATATRGTVSLGAWFGFAFLAEVICELLGKEELIHEDSQGFSK